MKMFFADKLIKLRKRSGMSQEELADRLDVSRQSVSKWESAQCLPDLNKIVAISKIFEVSVDYLIKDESEDPTTTPEAERETIVATAAEKAVSYAKYSVYSTLRTALALILLCVSPLAMILMRRNVRLSVSNLDEIYGSWGGQVDLGVFEQWQNMFDKTVEIGYNNAMTKGVTAFVVLAIAGVALTIYDFVRNRTVVFAEESDFENKKNKYSGREKGLVNIYMLVGSVIVGIVAVIPPVISSLTSMGSEGGAVVCLLLSAVSAILFCCAEKRIEAAVRYGARPRIEGKRISPTDKLTVCCAYWVTVVFVYFVWNVCDFQNTTSWVILPVAALISVFAFAVPTLSEERRYVGQKS